MSRHPIIRRPSVLVLLEKHEHRYFLVRDDAQLFRVALAIVKERAAEYGSHYPEPHEEEERVAVAALNAIKRDDGALAWHVLQCRRFGQYEGFNVEELEIDPGIGHERRVPATRGRADPVVGGMTARAFADRLVDNVSCATQLDPEKGELPNVDDWRRNAEKLVAELLGVSP